MHKTEVFFLKNYKINFKMEIPNNPTPGIHYEPIEGGTTTNPVITDLTYGAEEDSRIFHATENGKFFFLIFFCKLIFS